jgi:hypothetical protein
VFIIGQKAWWSLRRVCSDPILTLQPNVRFNRLPYAHDPTAEEADHQLLSDYAGSGQHSHIVEKVTNSVGVNLPLHGKGTKTLNAAYSRNFGSQITNAIEKFIRTILSKNICDGL